MPRSGDLTSSALAPLGRCRAEIRAKARRGPGRDRRGLPPLHPLRHLRSPGSLGRRCLCRGVTRPLLEGDAEPILLVERTALNILSRMSGIATATRSMAEEARKVRPSLRVAATRKTCPGMRVLDKKAVVLGGGEAHRATLSDMILIKDNHLKLVPLLEAVKRARRSVPSVQIEVEVTSGEEAVLAAEAGAGVIMFDNMDPASIGEAIRDLEARGPEKTGPSRGFGWDKIREPERVCGPRPRPDLRGGPHPFRPGTRPEPGSHLGDR